MAVTTDGTLAVAFSDNSPASPIISESDDIYLATLPAASLPAGAWNVRDVTVTHQDHDREPMLVAQGQRLLLAWHYYQQGHSDAIALSLGSATGTFAPPSLVGSVTSSDVVWLGGATARGRLAVSAVYQANAASGRYDLTITTGSGSGHWQTTRIGRVNPWMQPLPTSWGGGYALSYLVSTADGAKRVMLATGDGDTWRTHAVTAPMDALEWAAVAQVSGHLRLLSITNGTGSGPYTLHSTTIA